MAFNSSQPTLLCVITLCVCLSSLYDQDVPFLDFFVLFFVVVVAVIVVKNHLLGMDWSVVIPLDTIICLPTRGAGVGRVSFLRLHLLFFVIVVALIVVLIRLSGMYWYVVIPLGTIICISGGRSRYLWSVIFRVSFVWLYPIFRRRRRCTYICQEWPFRKGWVFRNPSGHYHLHTCGRSRCGFSCLGTTFLSFLSLSSLHS